MDYHKKSTHTQRHTHSGEYFVCGEKKNKEIFLLEANKFRVRERKRC